MLNESQLLEKYGLTKEQLEKILSEAPKGTTHLYKVKNLLCDSFTENLEVLAEWGCYEKWTKDEVFDWAEDVKDWVFMDRISDGVVVEHRVTVREINTDIRRVSIDEAFFDSGILICDTFMSDLTRLLESEKLRFIEDDADYVYDDGEEGDHGKIRYLNEEGEHVATFINNGGDDSYYELTHAGDDILRKLLIDVLEVKLRTLYQEQEVYEV